MLNEAEIGTEMADSESHNTQAIDKETVSIIKASCPITLKFADIVYRTNLRKKGVNEEKLNLKDISGIVYPGEMLAMLGPSGSGKTTLLTALGGRLGGHLTGTIAYNSKPFSSSMKRNSGFVTQDDVLYPRLTVAETLVYTAFLCLPKTVSKLQKVQQAEATMTKLGLSRCKDSIIGGPIVRGVSGGERKRVSIGQEMLTNPSLLFLDEPTSGLDSTTALRIVSMLLDLANEGRTIVLTIHQPSNRLFNMFHKVILLSEGNPIYFGTGANALEYFSSISFAPSQVTSPAEFLLDLANGVCSADSREDQTNIKQKLVSAYKIKLSPIVKSEIDTDHGHIYGLLNDKQFKGWSNSWWNQFSVLLERSVKVRKHESFSFITISQVLVSAILVGLLWWKSNISHLQDQVGLLFYYSIFWGFYTVNQAISTFPQELMMLAKERSSGMYRLSSYFLALTVGDMPMELVLPTVFFTITYWIANLKPTAWSFLSGLFTLLYSVLCSQGLGLAIGAVVMDQNSAIVLATVIMANFILFSGYYAQHVPVFVRWIKYLSISNHTFKLMLRSQFKQGETYPCAGNNGTCLIEDFPAVKAVGLDGQAIAIVALAVMLVGYRLIAYVALMRIGATKN